MTVRLRAHHLLCLLTYVGKGYSPAFTANYDAIAGRIGQGEDIVLVSGPDDICAPLLVEADPHCLRPGVAERDRRAGEAVSDLLGRTVEPGVRLLLDPREVQAMRSAFSTGHLRAACKGCDWHALCTRIAQAGYDGVRLGPPSDG